MALDARNPAAQGEAAQGRMLWFVHVGRAGRVAVYQATVLGQPNSAEAGVTFFEGLHLP